MSLSKIFGILYFLACTQETYTGNNGTIDFPGEGNNYNNSLNCLFKISVPEDHLVQFKFSRFDFELVGDGTKCDESYDWLRFIDGNDVNDNTTDFCNSGPGANKSYSSTNNEITLWMYKDNAAGGKGEKVLSTKGGLILEMFSFGLRSSKTCAKSLSWALST